MTIVEFLLARIAEDENVARDAAGWSVGEWTRLGVNSVVTAGSGSGVIHGDGGPPSDAEAEHIARYDPKRVLAECAAKRAIIDDWDAGANPDTDWGAGFIDGHGSARENAVRALAAVYADHPDCRGEWKP